MMNEVEQLVVPNGLIEVDRASGAITALQLSDPDRRFVSRADTRGLLRLAAPLAGFGAHYVETGLHGRPVVERDGESLRLYYSQLASSGGAIPVSVEITLTPRSEGLVLRARVHNGWTETIPQIVFPQLFGLGPVDGSECTRLQLGRGRLYPFEELTLLPESARYLDLGLYRYYPYGFSDFNMKWLDYGDSNGGITLYSRDSRFTQQGLIADRPDRAEDRLDLRWIHYPFIEAGETWESGDYVLLLHPGDWYAGARAYQDFARTAYPYRAPTQLGEALGIRSIWLSFWNAPPMYRFAELPALAAELNDLGLAEMCVWGWQTHFGYPMNVDPRLGTEAELSAAMHECQERGVPISLFTTHHLVADGPDTDDSWLHLNAARQREINNWTYNRDFLPRFGPLFSATHSCIRASALSPEWRATGLESYQQLLDMGATSICFDQFFPWNDLNYNPERDGRPNEEGEKLLKFGEDARTLIHASNPAGTFSGEGVADASVSVLDYTWEWRDSQDLAGSGPFRFVFPQFRLNANINEHPRGALLAFVEGALLNVMPGGMERRLGDCPALVSTLRKLALLRRRLLDYFTEGQFHFQEGLAASGCVARLYSHLDRILVLAMNPSDQPSELDIRIDRSDLHMAIQTGQLRVYDLDGNELEEMPCPREAVRYGTTLEPDGLRILEITPVRAED